MTQKEIAEEIREQGAGYVLALKGNHPRIHRERSWARDTRRRSVETPEWLTGFDGRRDLESLLLIEATRVIKDQSATEL